MRDAEPVGRVSVRDEGIELLVLETGVKRSCHYYKYGPAPVSSANLVRVSEHLCTQHPISHLPITTQPWHEHSRSEICGAVQMYDSERQIGDDGDSSTEISEACLIQDDTIRLINVSHIFAVCDQRTDLSKQFWNLRYQVQKIQPPFYGPVQMDISFRLAALNQVSRFDTKATLHNRGG